jgi:hypothetical protein
MHTYYSQAIIIGTSKQWSVVPCYRIPWSMQIIGHDINEIQVPEEKCGNECLCSMMRALLCILTVVLVIESRMMR